MKSYLKGQDLWEIVGGNETQPSTEAEALRKWNINAGKAMFAINTIVEHDMLQHIKKASLPNDAWDTFVNLFSKKNNTRLQLLENEIMSTTQGDLTINQYFTKVVPQLSCPIALFTYYNPIMKRGTEAFMSTIRDSGVHGLVVPDVPLEETATLRTEAKKNGIELVLLTTPTTPTDRMKAIVEASEGFVYLVSSMGVTGARTAVSDRVQDLLQEIKETTTKPVAVGFGISTPEQVKQVASWGADGVIVGSAMVKLLGEAKSAEHRLKELESFTHSLKSSLP